MDRPLRRHARARGAFGSRFSGIPSSPPGVTLGSARIFVCAAEPWKFCGKSPRGLPKTLRRQAVDVLLGVRGGAEPAVPRNTGEPIGVEARHLPLFDQQVDHPHRGLFHRLVEVGVAAMRNIVRCRILRRQRARRLRLRILAR
jgi:hypothetical protein